MAYTETDGRVKREQGLERWQEILLCFVPDLVKSAPIPELGDLELYFMDRGRLHAESAIFLARQLEKTAKAWEFLEKHPVAPRKWRSKVNRKSF